MLAFTFRPPQGKFFPANKNIFSLRELLSVTRKFPRLNRNTYRILGLLAPSIEKKPSGAHPTKSLSIQSEKPFRLPSDYFRLLKKFLPADSATSRSVPFATSEAPGHRSQRKNKRTEATADTRSH